MHSDTARLGLALASSQGARQSLLSQVAYLEVDYEVTWPLSVVLAAEDLARYRTCMPVLLQLHWVRHNLALASKALWLTRQGGRAAELVPPSADPTQPPLTLLTVADALLHMHHTVATLHRCMLSGALSTAWHELETALAGGEAADLDDICVLHRAYLARIEACCMLGDDSTSKVR